MLKSTCTLRALFFGVIFGFTTSITTSYSKELPLVISVCSFNCAPWVQRNLDSIFLQEYTQFRVVYVDDASHDGTVELVEEYKKEHNLGDKLTIMANQTRQGKMKNVYNVFHSCDDDEIIIQIDADDWLPHAHVFERINQVYQSGNVWLTYSEFFVYPEGTKEWCTPMPVPEHILKKRSYRHWKWVFTHMRTFYAWLFKSVKLEDFIAETSPGYLGKFFPLCNDMAAYFPMLEMCGPNFAFIPEKLYVYNRDNPNLGAKLLGHLYKPVGEDIRTRDKYPLIEHPRPAAHSRAHADAIIISSGDSQALERLLTSLKNHVTGIESITVLFHKNKKAMADCQVLFPNVQFTKVAGQTVNSALKKALFQGNARHVLLTHDALFVQQDLDLASALHDLETTQAHAYYFGYTPSLLPFYSTQTGELVPCQHVWEELHTWKFRVAPTLLSNTLDMTLFAKQTVLERLQLVPDAKTTYYFIDAWHTTPMPHQHSVGLFGTQHVLGGTLNATNLLINHPMHVPTHIAMKDFIDTILEQTQSPLDIQNIIKDEYEQNYL